MTFFRGHKSAFVADFVNFAKNNALKSVELLAPAKDFQSAVAAVDYGADAVYIGGAKFGARYAAGNSAGEIARVVEYAHRYGVRVHATLNTLIYDDELEAAGRQARELIAAGVDALIVQDMALRRMSLPVELHASTQVCNSTPEGARFLGEAGFARVILERNLSLDEIRAICSATAAEVECFVHGAICVGFSGRCFLSRSMSGRSGNRGACSQPCRLAWDLADGRGRTYIAGKHLLSVRDMNLSHRIGDLLDAGVTSFKIEGRVKKAFYVATVVNAYRQVLDGGDPVQWGSELECISHRPYSTGFFYGDAQQSFEDDIYVQLYDWVAEVVESRPIEATATENDLDLTQGMWQTIVYCRNRFYEGDTLELLSPHCEVTPVLVVGLEEVFPVVDVRDDEGLDNPELKDASASKQNERCFDSSERAVAIANTIPVEVANKAMGAYAFITPMPLHRYDILRAKRRDPSKKN